MNTPLTPFQRYGQVAVAAVALGHTVTLRPRLGQFALIVDGVEHILAELPPAGSLVPVAMQVKLANLATAALIDLVPRADPECRA